MSKLAFTLISILVSISFAKTNKEQIRLEIRNHAKEVNGCYAEQLKLDPNISSGKVVIRFEINDKGKVAKANINETQTNFKNKTVHDCLINKLKVLDFPPAEKGQAVEVNFPFVFTKNK